MSAKSIGRRLGFLGVGAFCALWILFCAAGSFIEPPSDVRVPEARNPGPVEISAETWSVAILADIQNGFVYLPEVFRRARAKDPKAILILGDISSRPTRRHMQLPVRQMQRHPPPAPLFVVPGNHDIKRGKGEAEFIRWFGATTFEFLLGRTRFVGLNNAEGPLEEAVLARLEHKLTAAARRGEDVVLCLHREVIDWPGKRGAGAEARNRRLLELIGRFSNVRFVLTGHHHQPWEETRGPTRFIVLPPSGDRSADTGWTPISLFTLRYEGGRYRTEVEKFSRDVFSELEGIFLYLWLAKVRPLPGLLFWALVLLAAAGVAAGAAWGVRRR